MQTMLLESVLLNDRQVRPRQKFDGYAHNETEAAVAARLAILEARDPSRTADAQTATQCRLDRPMIRVTVELLPGGDESRKKFSPPAPLPTLARAAYRPATTLLIFGTRPVGRGDMAP